MAARLVFDTPTEVIVASSAEEVPGAIERAEASAISGNHVVGFVSYEAAGGLDAALGPMADGALGASPSIPLAWFAVFPHASPAARRAPADAGAPVTDWQPSVSRGEHARQVAAIQDGIRDGAVYQVNYTFRLQARFDGDTLALYERLRLAQAAPFSAWLRTGTLEIASVSPELFFQRVGREVTCRPMKGTARRGRWLDEDDAAAGRLRASVKERAENVMIVDLVRNDLGRISEIGSVRVRSLFDVERYPTVLQMTSTVESRLRGEVGLAGLFAALFPCGSVVGAPKRAAAHWIARAEGGPRGIYCGAIGILRPGGDCTFSVAIRTVVAEPGAGLAYYGTGSAVTIDSDPMAEYEECIAKAAVLRRVQPSFCLLETLRLEEGSYVRLDRHLARLAESGLYFGFPDVQGRAARALARLASRMPAGRHRVRLLVARNGRAVTHVDALPAMPCTDAPERVAFASEAVDSSDPFLFHKTTHRVVYDTRRSERPDVFDVLLSNERGEVTEFTIGNVVVELEGARYTPPRASGLLAGTFRAELLDSGQVAERVLTRDDVRQASRLWLVNSLRGWTPVRVAVPGFMAACK